MSYHTGRGRPLGSTCSVSAAGNPESFEQQIQHHEMTVTWEEAKMERGGHVEGNSQTPGERQWQPDQEEKG